MFVIELNDGDAPTYWSDSPLIHPAGNWGEREAARRFLSDTAARAYITSTLTHQAELCKVVPL